MCRMVDVCGVSDFAGAYQAKYVSHGLLVSQSRVWATEEPGPVQGQTQALTA